MSQPMPVVRQLYWPGLIPQWIAILLLAVIVYFCFPMATIFPSLVAGAVIYLVICRSLRALLVRDHTRGMAAYRAGNFQEAISHFQASHRFFSAHRRLDSWRSFVFGVASRNPYRVIALGNMAYCHGQLGEGAKAIELYEEVLREAPDHTLAKSMLNLLKAVPPTKSPA
jgi:tetratricopeptide (TPR) repeat protein